jgi:hypothetical protein
MVDHAFSSCFPRYPGTTCHVQVRGAILLLPGCFDGAVALLAAPALDSANAAAVGLMRAAAARFVRNLTLSLVAAAPAADAGGGDGLPGFPTPQLSAPQAAALHAALLAVATAPLPHAVAALAAAPAAAAASAAAGPTASAAGVAAKAEAEAAAGAAGAAADGAWALRTLMAKEEGLRLTKAPTACQLLVAALAAAAASAQVPVSVCARRSGVGAPQSSGVYAHFRRGCRTCGEVLTARGNPHPLPSVLVARAAGTQVGVATALVAVVQALAQQADAVATLVGAGLLRALADALALDGAGPPVCLIVHGACAWSMTYTPHSPGSRPRE